MIEEVLKRIFLTAPAYLPWKKLSLRILGWVCSKPRLSRELRSKNAWTKKFLKPQDCVGLSWFTHHCNITWTSGAMPIYYTNRLVWCFLLWRGFLPVTGDFPSRYSLFEDTGQNSLVNGQTLKSRQPIEVLSVKHWTSCIPSLGHMSRHESFHHQSTWGLWVWRRYSTMFHRVPCEVLHKYGVRGLWLWAIQYLYIVDSKLGLFSVRDRFCQGCLFSPILFITFMDLNLLVHSWVEGVQFGGLGICFYLQMMWSCWC